MEKEVPCQFGPKKLRLREEKPTNSSIQCVICQANDQSNLNKVLTGPVDENLKEWAKASKNFVLIRKLVATVSDAHAMDACYHLVCYTRPREAALTANRQESKIYFPPFDPIICAQIMAFIEHSEGVFKLSQLREMYLELMSDQGNPCKDRKEPHASRFKDHLLSLLPEWSEFSGENKGRKDIYISHEATVADELAKKHDF